MIIGGSSVGSIQIRVKKGLGTGNLKLPQRIFLKG